MLGAKPEAPDLTDFGLPPLPALVVVVTPPYSFVDPTWKKNVVSAPLGSTLPCSVAVVGAILVTPPVVTPGFATAPRAPAGSTSAPATTAAIGTPRLRMLPMPSPLQ